MKGAMSMNDERITKGSGNVFADIGLSEPEERLAKSDLAMNIAQIIRKRHLSQAEAAKVLGISQPKVSKILNGHLSGFSMEKLLLLMMALDRDIEIRVKKRPRSSDHSKMRVTYA